jgi:hypothetical protein
LIFFFFTKTTSFWFFLKIKNWFRRPSDPVKTQNPDLRPGRV